MLLTIFTDAIYQGKPEPYCDSGLIVSNVSAYYFRKVKEALEKGKRRGEVVFVEDYAEIPAKDVRVTRAKVTGRTKELLERFIKGRELIEDAIYWMERL